MNPRTLHKKWEGGVQVSQERSSHGAHSARVRFEPGHSQISATKLPQDWRSYDRLLFDIYCDRETMSMAALRIYDSMGADSGGPNGDDYYEARGKILVLKGWNHVEVKLQPLRAASDERDLSLESHPPARDFSGPGAIALDVLSRQRPSGGGTGRAAKRPRARSRKIR